MVVWTNPADFSCRHVLCQVYQMELQTLFEIGEIAVSALKYHVVSSVPDFQTKPADSRPGRLALIVGFKMVVVIVKGEKNAHPPTGVLNVPNRFLVYLKLKLYHSSQSLYCTLHQIQVRYLLGVRDGDGEGRFFPFSPRKIAGRGSSKRFRPENCLSGLVLWTGHLDRSWGLVLWPCLVTLVIWTCHVEGSVD